MKKKQTLGTFISKNIIYIAFVIMLIGLSVFTSSFLQMKNLVNVLRQATVVGVLSMGITKGTEVFVRKVAPLGDPMELTVRNYELSVRKADAEMIEVE